jgi:plastocyanin
MINRRIPRLFAPLALGVVGLVPLAACGSSAKPSTGGTAATAPAGSVEIDAKDGNLLDKPEYDAKSGAVTIVYVNKSSVNHNLLVSDSAGAQIGTTLKVQNTGAKDTGTYTLAAGTYNVYCNIPGHEKMKAKLVVG